MTGPVLLRASGVAVAYGETRALAGVDLEVRAGEVHALLGENGAGKSTLLKVIAGAVRPDAGALELAGAPFAPRGPAEALALGVATIHQELTVLPHLSVAENLLLGREPRGPFGLVDRRAAAAAAREALAMLGRVDLDPRARLGSLGPADRQIVEIARAMLRDARVLVMDEPTSSLGSDDVERLFALVRQLRDRGLAVIHVSHFLEEVRAVADRCTVLRDGTVAGGGELAALDDAQLVRLMVGRELGELFPPRRPAPGAVVLRVDGLVGVPLPAAASLELHRGEILGIGGLCGAGRSELLEAIFGLRGRRAGAVLRDGVAVPALPAAAWARGIGLLVEDRKTVGLALRRPLAHNLLLPCAGRHARAGLLSPRRLSAAAAPFVQRLGVRCASPLQPVGQLSGGNQQKVCVARLLAAGADVLLLDEPTRGVDVASRQEIYRALDAAARAGAAVLVVSSQLPELLGLCDRIAVMRRGVLHPARPATDWTQEQLLAAAIQPDGAAA